MINDTAPIGLELRASQGKLAKATKIVALPRSGENILRLQRRDPGSETLSLLAIRLLPVRR